MIEIKNLSVKLEKKEILKNISLQIGEKEIISVIGPNGAGKSTLLKALLNLIPYETGEFYLHKHNEKVSLHQLTQKEFAKFFAYIPQEHNMQFDYTVREIILMGRFPWIDYWSSFSKKDRLICEEISELFKVETLLDRSFNHLSGGEKQRVLLARAFAQETPYIFLDETLSFLDINHQIEIMQLLQEIHIKQNKCIVIVSHNINLSIEYSDRLIIVKSGEILAQGKATDIISGEIIQKTFNLDIHIINNPITKKPNLLYSNSRSL